MDRDTLYIWLSMIWMAIVVMARSTCCLVRKRLAGRKGHRARWESFA